MWVQILPLPLNEFCGLEKILSISMPQFPSVGTYFTGLLERLDVLHSISFDDGEGEGEVI